MRRTEPRLWWGHVDLAGPEPVHSQRWGTLTAEDRAHVAARPATRRRQTEAALHLLRGLLAAHVADARTCDVRRAPGRKPRLAYSRLDYSVTHSATRVAVVLTTGGRVGVDLQRVEPRWDVGALADRVLTPHEVAWLGCRTTESAGHAFAEAWARKEALAKLGGDGVTAAFAELDASRTPRTSIGSAVHGDWAAAVAWDRGRPAGRAVDDPEHAVLAARGGVDGLAWVAAAVAQGL